MASPLILIKTLGLLETVVIFLFPIALVTSITLSGILLYVGVAVLILLLLFDRGNKFKNYNFTSLDKAFIIYIILFTLSKLINTGFDEGLNTFSRVSQDYFVFLWLSLFTSCKREKLKLIKSAIFIAAILTISYGIMQFFHLDLFHRQSNIERLSGFHKNSYTYGGQLIIFFFFLFSQLERNLKGLLCLLLSLLAFFCMFNTLERAVIIGVAVGLIFYVIANKFRKKDLFSLILFFGIPSLFILLFNNKLFKRFKAVSQAKKKNVRFKLWEMALSLWKRNVIFGVGKFPVVAHQLQGQFKIQYLTHAHNVFLQLLVTNGLVGLLSFLNLFFNSVKVLFRSASINKLSLAYISLLIAFLVEGCFEYLWGDSEVRYLLLFFMSYVISNSFCAKSVKLKT